VADPFPAISQPGARYTTSTDATWSSRPAWRSHRTLYVVCAQLLELGDAIAQALVALAETVGNEATSGKPAGQFYEVSDQQAEAIRDTQIDEA